MMNKYTMRLWSARNARWLARLYNGLEGFLSLLHPLFARIGYQRLDRHFLAAERKIKGFLFDSQSCGQCTLKLTGMSCPMNCPKQLRNGPCGGVRPNGNCEVIADMPCVWVVAWEGRRRLDPDLQAVRFVLPPADDRLKNTSAWLREVRKRHAYPETGYPAHGRDHHPDLHPEEHPELYLDQQPAQHLEQSHAV